MTPGVQQIILHAQVLGDDFEYAISQQVLIFAKAGYMTHVYLADENTAVIEYAFNDPSVAPYSYWLSLEESTMIDEVRAANNGVEVNTDA